MDVWTFGRLDVWMEFPCSLFLQKINKALKRFKNLLFFIKRRNFSKVFIVYLQNNCNLINLMKYEKKHLFLNGVFALPIF